MRHSMALAAWVLPLARRLRAAALPRAWKAGALALAVAALLLAWGTVMERSPAGPAAPAPLPGIEMLDRAWEATGGELEQALLFVREPVADRPAAERIAAGLGWTGPAPAGEERSLRLVEGAGGPYVEVAWRLSGEAARTWAERYRELRRAFAREGLWPPVHVELSGRAGEGGDPLALTEAALDAVKAGERQPWQGPRSASVAGYSPLLPPGPYAVNVQAAARSGADGTRLWVGWPVVRSDY